MTRQFPYNPFRMLSIRTLPNTKYELQTWHRVTKRTNKEKKEKKNTIAAINLSRQPKTLVILSSIWTTSTYIFIYLALKFGPRIEYQLCDGFVRIKRYFQCNIVLQFTIELSLCYKKKKKNLDWERLRKTARVWTVNRIAFCLSELHLVALCNLKICRRRKSMNPHEVSI